MPKIEAEKPRPLCPAGKQILQLISCEVKEVRDFNDKNRKVPKLLWIFNSDKIDPETGEEYEMAVWSFQKYGNPKATLTKLLNGMIPGMSIEKAEDPNFNTDDLLLQRYEAVIVHGENEAGQPKDEIASILPLAVAQPAPSIPPPAASPKKLPPAWASRRQAVIDKLVAKGYSPEGSAETVDENGPAGDMKALKELEETIDAGGYDIADPFNADPPSAAAAVSANAATSAVMAGAV